MGKQNPKTVSALRRGRPPRVITKSSSQVSLSARATRTLIRSHHQLQKAYARAIAANDHATAANLEAQIQANGGIESYQIASIKGQSVERGGDSSKVLIDWLAEKGGLLNHLTAAEERGLNIAGAKLRCLEVGALSTRNIISRTAHIEVERIDLNSQEKGILQQDFMTRPLPRRKAGGSETFHLVSLSLVLNYVSDPQQRGDMLKRTAQFLNHEFPASFQGIHNTNPCLFLVLPAACVQNSRYLTEQRLLQIMKSIGYLLVKQKESNKLIYQLWEHPGDMNVDTQSFKKQELNPGRNRNNFAIILR